MDRAVASWVEQHARRTPDRTALVDLHSGRETTYGAFAARVRSLAWSLSERLGVRHGDRVAVLSRNDPRVFEVLYACGLLGAIAVPLNWRLTRAELTAITADAAPVVLVHESHASGTAAAVATDAGVEHLLVWTSETGEVDTYEALATAAVPTRWEPDLVDDDTVWTIIYTSGTTGLPKGVQATHANVLASLLGILVAHRVDAASRCLTVLPTFPVAGLALFAHPTLYVGGTVVVARTFEPAEIMPLLTDPRTPVTHFCGVPANYQLLQQLPEFETASLLPFVAAVGGSPVPPTLVSDWAVRGVTLSTVFGITEAGACVTAMPRGRELDRNATIGVPVLHARCRVRRLDDHPAAAGETGELQIAGPLVTPRYWRNPDATTAAVTDDGWLRTGDAASITDDAFVVLARGADTVEPAALVAWCREHLATYKIPSRVRLVDELPRNATGKVLKGALRAVAAQVDLRTSQGADS